MAPAALSHAFAAVPPGGRHHMNNPCKVVTGRLRSDLKAIAKLLLALGVGSAVSLLMVHTAVAKVFACLAALLVGVVLGLRLRLHVRVHVDLVLVLGLVEPGVPDA